MNERIKELAEQAGMSYLKFISQEQMELVERFAELVRQDERTQCAADYLEDCARAVEAARLEEREACAQLCEKHYPYFGNDYLMAARIRGRTE